MATNKGNQGNQRQGQDSSQRGFAGMDDDRQRDAASKGGQVSANEQRRDDQGQFAGTGSGSRGSSTGRASSNQGNTGQGNTGQGSTRQGNSGQMRDEQGQFTSGGQSQSRTGSGGSNR
jgi:hypothetical protein